MIETCSSIISYNRQAYNFAANVVSCSGQGSTFLPFVFLVPVLFTSSTASWIRRSISTCPGAESSKSGCRPKHREATLMRIELATKGRGREREMKRGCELMDGEGKGRNKEERTLLSLERV